MERKQKIALVATNYRLAYGKEAKGYEEIDFKAGAEWADQHPQSPWISIRKMLPNKDQDVIMCDKYGNIFIGCIKFVIGERNMMYLETYRRIGDVKIEDITHWMHIPQPPKGGEE